MRSVLLRGSDAVTCVDVAAPDPGPGEVVIRTRVSAICGSELKGYRGAGAATGNSGHEAAGVVERLGPGVTSLREGERVGVSAVVGCGDCCCCERGQYTWCRNRRMYSSMHAEQFVTQAHACRPLPDDLPWAVGVLITGDGFGVPYHTNTKIPGQTGSVAIFGMGPVGLGNALMQSSLGRRVIAIDVAPRRLELARELGAAEAVQATGTVDVVAAVRDLTAGDGADVCIEAAGRPETAAQCFRAVRTAGTVGFNGEQPAVELSPSEDFIRRDITAVGSWFYHFGEFDDMLQLYRDGLAVDRLITHRLALEEAAEGYRLMAAGESGKVLLEMGTAAGGSG